VKHRGVDFDVKEDPPGVWRWKIYPKIEARPKVIGEAKCRSREAAPLLPLLKRSITALREADVAAAPNKNRPALGPFLFRPKKKGPGRSGLDPLIILIRNRN
jgi:hypothetical protein